MGRSRTAHFFKSIEIATRRAFIRWLSSRSEPQQPKLPLELGEAPTILFLRQDRLGDAIISTPLLVAMREKYPKAHFILLLGNNNKDIVPLLPIEAEVFIYRKQPLHDIPMLRRLRKRRIDAVVDLMDNPSATSSILVAAIGARYSVGVEKENSSVYNVRVPLLDRGTYHISRRMIELVSPFGIDPESVNLRSVLKGIAVDTVAGRLGLNSSAGHPDRELSVETLAGVAREAIVRGLATEVLVFYHPRDVDRAKSIIALADNAAVKLAPITKNFEEYAQSLATCEFVVTPDTSAIHLCSAFGIPVVGIYPIFPPTLHYWTPVGVAFEMIIHDAPTLEAVRPEPVISGLERLVGRVHDGVSHHSPSPEYVA